MSLEVRLALVRDGFDADVEFEAEGGTTLVLLGPNGSGKSTVLSCLAGLLHPDRGRIRLDGEVLLDTEARIDVSPRRRQVGVLFQDGLLFPHLSALDNVTFPLLARGDARPGAEEAGIEILDRLGFPAERRGSRPAALSGGEAQRVALARALIPRPRLLLLDEPTSALDVRSRNQLRPAIARALAAFAGVRVLVTHDPVEAMTLGDRIVVVEDGRVSQAGTVDDLRRSPATPYVAEVVGVNVFRGPLRRDDGAWRIEAPEGAVFVADPGLPEDTVVIGVMLPGEIELHLERPPEGSAQNVVEGTVDAVAVDGQRARVRVDGRPPVLAEITLSSAERLALRPGARVWSSFKAVGVSVEPA